MDLAERIGRTLVFGVPGTRVTPRVVRLFRETHAGGLILFRINFESAAQVRRLVSDLEDALGRRLLVTVDHEAGRVVMFGEGVTIFPDNLAFGTAARPAEVRRQGRIEAAELRRLGMDVAFSPVADVLTDVPNPAIGIRSYGWDPRAVSRFVAARVRGLQEGGVSACAKHFPGLGPAALDPHKDLPSVGVSWKELRRVHLPPFVAALRAGVDTVMTSHPLYPRLDPSPRTPATFSRRLVHDLLRRELGFRGVTVSDDLEMGALRRLCSVGRAAVLAAKAGHDLLLSCHDEVSQRRVHRALLDAYRSGELKLAGLESSADRIQRLADRRHNAPGAVSAKRGEASSEAERMADRVADRAVRVGVVPAGGARSARTFFRSRPRTASLARGVRTVSAVFPRLSSLADRVLIEEELRHEARFLERELSARGLRPTVRLTALDPSARETAAAASAARNADVAVVFSFDAHLYPGGRRLLRAVGAAARRLAVVAMRNPEDVRLLPPGTLAATGFGYRVRALKSVLRALFGARR
jgi:beta-N-acetylhexosaminidase